MRNKKCVQYDFRVGERFGRLVLTGLSFIHEYNGYRRRFVEAACDCGKVDTYIFDSIQREHTRSCGCLQKDYLRLHPHRKTHGLTKHPLFKVWDGMKNRCYDKNAINYCDYGAKGIIICDEWLKDFKKFYDWAIAAGWKEGLTVDRFPDTKGNYEPSNCRIASQKAQRMNRNDLNLITAFGETKCALDWSLDKRCKVSYGGLRTRLYRDKKDWPDVEKAITTPAKTRGLNVSNRAENRMLVAFGETKSIADWLKDERCKADEQRIRRRIWKGVANGWTDEKAIITPIRKLPPIKMAV